MVLLIQYTLIFASVLILVALGGCFSEHSGVINIGLEGIMVMGALGGALMMKFLPAGTSAPVMLLLVVLAAMGLGLVYSLLLAVAAINFKADQTLVGTAMNLLGTAAATVFVKAMNTAENVNNVSSTIQYIEPKKAFIVNIAGFEFNWFMLLALIALVLAYVTLYKTRFGLRLCACGEHPQAADSVGINVYKMRYAGVLISGVLGGLGGIVYITAGVSEWKFENGVAGFGFLARAVMIFGQWKPTRIALAALVFGHDLRPVEAHPHRPGRSGVRPVPRPGQRVHRIRFPGCPQPAQQRVQHAALYHLPHHPGLHLQQVPRTQGRGYSLRQGTALTAHNFIPDRGPLPIRAAALFLLHITVYGDFLLKNRNSWEIRLLKVDIYM